VTGSIALLWYLAGAAWRASDLTEVLVGPHRRSGRIA
jgi:hypothetical protein